MIFFSYVKFFSERKNIKKVCVLIDKMNSAKQFTISICKVASFADTCKLINLIHPRFLPKIPHNASHQFYIFPHSFWHALTIIIHNKRLQKCEELLFPKCKVTMLYFTFFFSFIIFYKKTKKLKNVCRIGKF